jgi:hypothetical protein
MFYVALLTDANGNYFYAYDDVANFKELASKLEDIGAEVIEDQTDDWDGDIDAIKEDCYTIDELLIQSGFVSSDDVTFYEDDFCAIGCQSYSVTERNSSLV